MSEPPQKKSKTESGSVDRTEQNNETNAAADGVSSSPSSVEVASTSSSNGMISLRSDLLDLKLIKQGAEGRVFSCTFMSRPCIMKERFSKSYRHPLLDAKLSSQRLTQEVRTMLKCRRQAHPIEAVYTPAVYCVDEEKRCIYMERIEGSTVKDVVSKLQLHTEEDEKTGLALAAKIGKGIGGIHAAGIIHGDLTTSNLMLTSTPNDPIGALSIIDFGLASISQLNEDRAVDLYVLERAFLSTHPNSEKMFAAVLSAYSAAFGHSSKVLAKLNAVRARGRKRQMVG